MNWAHFSHLRAQRLHLTNLIFACKSLTFAFYIRILNSNFIIFSKSYINILLQLKIIYYNTLYIPELKYTIQHRSVKATYRSVKVWHRTVKVANRSVKWTNPCIDDKHTNTQTHTLIHSARTRCMMYIHLIIFTPFFVYISLIHTYNNIYLYIY